MPNHRRNTDFVGDTQIHERISILEANSINMDKGMQSLSVSISTLNNKLETITNKFSNSAGILISVLFIFQFIVVPIVLFFVFKISIKP